MNSPVKETYYINPSAKGVYRTIINEDQPTYSELIKKLLRLKATPPLTKRVLYDLFETDDYEMASEAFKKAHSEGYVRLLSNPKTLPETARDKLLHDYLAQLFKGYSALLVDEEGFELANSGFNQQQASAYAAMAGALIGFQESRVKPLIDNNLIKSKIWKICDHTGKAEVSFYPFVSDQHIYMMVTKGGLLLNQMNLTDLARLLFIKY